MTTEEYIAENDRRQAVRQQRYDPILGTEHTPEIMPRKMLYISDAPLLRMNIPLEMWQEEFIQTISDCGSIEAFCKSVGLSYKGNYIDIWTEIEKLRCKYDFEYWCAVDVKILHKVKGTTSPFILNRPQRTMLLPVLEKLRKSGKAINVDLLKARQWGGSTCTEFYIIWIQRFWKENWNSAICADVDDQAKGILGMYERAAESFDTRLNNYQPLELESYMMMDTTRIIKSRGCTISIASAQHPDKLRSQNLKCAHLTEVGLWKSTPTKKPEDIVQSIFGTIMNQPYTIKILESTAKGVGNFFHRHWLKANDTENWNGFTPVFVSWFDIDMYQTSIKNYKTFVNKMDKYDKWLFEIGATLEGIAWYKETLKGMEEPWRMKSEFPSNAEEAFQSTGHNYFPNDYVEELREGCKPPKALCEIWGNDRTGKEALHNIEIREESNGKLKIWEFPDKETKMSDRYLVVVDLGVGKTDKADRSIICVFDRYWQHELNGIPEVVAEWAGHLDIDLLAWKAAQIATIYGNALLVVESNSAESSREDHFRTVLREIGEHYDNIYRRSKRDPVKGGVDRFGFHTNSSTKYLVCDYLLRALREGLYIERNEEAINEMRVFERKPNGTLGAVDGNHDDRVMTRAIGCYFMIAEGVMPVPSFVDESIRGTGYTADVSPFL